MWGPLVPKKPDQVKQKGSFNPNDILKIDEILPINTAESQKKYINTLRSYQKDIDFYSDIINNIIDSHDDSGFIRLFVNNRNVLPNAVNAYGVVIGQGNRFGLGGTTSKLVSYRRDFMSLYNDLLKPIKRGNIMKIEYYMMDLNELHSIMCKISNVCDELAREINNKNKIAYKIYNGEVGYIDYHRKIIPYYNHDYAMKNGPYVVILIMDI